MEEELSLGMKDDCKEKVDETLKALELSDYRERHPASLSGGQKQRVTIGAAIVKGSPVIYFDEPTSGLDYDSMVRVSKLIEQLSSSGVIVFVVSHDFEFIVRTCTEVVQLDDDGAIQNQRLSPEILKTLSENILTDKEVGIMFQKVFEYAGPHKKGLYAATAIVLVSVLMGVLPFVLAYQVIAPLVMGESIGASFIISRVALVLACLVLQALSMAGD